MLDGGQREFPSQWGGAKVNINVTNKVEMSSERRKLYNAALRAADSGDYDLLFDFVGCG